MIHVSKYTFNQGFILSNVYLQQDKLLDSINIKICMSCTYIFLGTAGILSGELSTRVPNDGRTDAAG